MVPQAREDRPRSSFEDTVAQARARGAAYRAQTVGTGRRVDFAKAPSKRVLALADSLPSSSSAGLPPSYHTGLDVENFLAHEEPYATAGSPSFPTEESSFNDKDSLFYGELRPAYKDQPRLPRPREKAPGFAGRGGPRDMKTHSP